MSSIDFRLQLRQRLEGCSDRILLRIVVGEKTVELTGADILDQSVELANKYCSAPERSVVLLLLPHSVELFLLQIGIVLINRVPAVLAWPTSRVDPEKYQRNLLHQLRDLPASQVITLPRLAECIGAAMPYTASACQIQGSEQFEKNFVQVDMGEGMPPEHSAAPAPEDTVFLQFSGGTTGSQKAVVVSETMLRAQLTRLAEALSFTEADSVVSWLPLYHDMGLIACLWFPLWHGASSLQFSATDWLLNPESLFRYMEKYRGTFCWLPNFAFSYLAAQRDRMQGHYQLGNVRGWISCSEPVRLASINQFLEQFGPWRIRSESLQASYAMAENVFAVSQSPLGTPLSTLPRSRVTFGGPVSQLAYGVIDDVYVSSGRPMAGNQFRIVENGRESAPGEPGDIEIRTESLFAGYWGRGGFRTESISSDGWYSTGDYGVSVGGELYVLGRRKDILIVGGQNIFPEDVEAVVNTLEGIYPGRVVAFGVDDPQLGTESLAIVGELRGEYMQVKAQALEREVKKLILSTIGVAPRYCSVVPERWIVKSTAGKLSRRETRARFMQEREALMQGARI